MIYLRYPGRGGRVARCRAERQRAQFSPLDDATPPAADLLTQQAYDLMPRVKITDLLLEVDQWTDFTRHFTHLKSEAKREHLVPVRIFGRAISDRSHSRLKRQLLKWN
jgi:hypothetical protein